MTWNASGLLLRRGPGWVNERVPPQKTPRCGSIVSRWSRQTLAESARRRAVEDTLESGTRLRVTGATISVRSRVVRRWRQRRQMRPFRLNGSNPLLCCAGASQRVR